MNFLTRLRAQKFRCSKENNSGRRAILFQTIQCQKEDSKMEASPPEVLHVGKRLWSQDVPKDPNVLVEPPLWARPNDDHGLC